MKIETQDQLKKILKYDPETGCFTWLIQRSSRRKIGDKAGYLDPGRYVRINVQGHLHYAHRLAFLYMEGAYPKNDVDHINRSKSDNRWINLRKATRTENFFNRPLGINNTSGYKGVSFDKSKNKFSAIATINGKSNFLGRFNSALEAHEAYVRFSKERHGQFLYKGNVNESV